MSIHTDDLKAIIEPVARAVDDHVPNACPDDEVVSIALPAADLRRILRLHEELDAR